MLLRQISASETIGRIDALDFQEYHSPTVIDEIMIKYPDAARPVRERARRRASDARLWGSLDALEQRAAEDITRGYNLITNGVGVKCQTFEKVYGRGDPDKDVRTMQDYHKWGRKCIAHGLSVNAVLNVLVEGRSCSEVDRQMLRRNGFSKENLNDALSIYIKLKGWDKTMKK